MNQRVVSLQPDVLERVVERARAEGARGVVVFDLDSTLLDNRPRQARILREFGAQNGIAPRCTGHIRCGSRGTHASSAYEHAQPPCTQRPPAR